MRGFGAYNPPVRVQHHDHVLAFVRDEFVKLGADALSTLVHSGSGWLSAEGRLARTDCGITVGLEEFPYGLGVVRIVPGAVDEEHSGLRDRHHSR